MDREIDRIKAERDSWRRLARARGDILVAYRLGRPTPEKALDAAADAVIALRELGINPDTGKVAE